MARPEVVPIDRVRDVVFGALRSTEGSMTAEQLSAAFDLPRGSVSAALAELSTAGEIFGIRYHGDPATHWRAIEPAPFSSAGTSDDGPLGAVRGVLRGRDWGLTARQLAAAVGMDVRSVRAILEGLFLENAVMRIRYRGSPTVYWRAAEVRARPSP